jgi:hypothetical protein
MEWTPSTRIIAKRIIMKKFLAFCLASDQDQFNFSPTMVRTAKQFLYSITSNPLIKLITLCYSFAFNHYTKLFLKHRIYLDPSVSQKIDNRIHCYLWIYWQNSDVIRNSL